MMNCQPATIADLAISREIRAASLAGAASRENLNKQVKQDWRGSAPAFSMENGKMAVRDWDSGELLPDFFGIAYDYMAKAFVLLGQQEGERSINYLLAKSREEASVESEDLKKRISQH